LTNAKLLTSTFVALTAAGTMGAPALSEEATPMIEFSTLEKTAKPNQWLVAPEGLLEKAEADAPSQRYSQTPSDLFDAALKSVKAQARATDIKSDTATLQIRYTATVPVVGFKDDVDIAVIPQDEGSAIAIYSRSRVGYSDFGVNKRRVDTLLAAIDAELAD